MWSCVVLLVLLTVAVAAAVRPIHDLNDGIARALVHQFKQVFPADDPWSELLLLQHSGVPLFPRDTMVLVQSSLLVHFANELAIYSADKQCDAYGKSVARIQNRFGPLRPETARLLPRYWWSQGAATALCRTLGPTPLVDGKRRDTFTSLKNMAGAMPSGYDAF